MNSCLYTRTPNNPSEVVHVAVSQLNQISITLSHKHPAAHVRAFFAVVKYAFRAFFSVWLQLRSFLDWSPCDEMSKWLGVSVMRQGGEVIEERRKWPTLIYPGCSLVWLVPSEHLAASHSLPLSPCDHRSPMSFLQGHKYFQQTPYCSHIIPQTPPNDSQRQTTRPFSLSRAFRAPLCS